MAPSHKPDSLVQDCSNSSALAMELLQSCTNTEMAYHCIWSSYLNNVSSYRGIFTLKYTLRFLLQSSCYMERLKILATPGLLLRDNIES